MRPARIIAALSVPLVILSACSSSKQAATVSSTTTVASSSAVPGPATAAPVAPTTPAVTSSKKTVAPTAKKKAVVKPVVKPAVKPVVKPVVKPAAKKPVPKTDPLTGGTPSHNPVIAAKIDNTYFAVPQFGISDADVVFVEQVEGGLTRLIAVFHTRLPTEVGPVRSVRSTDAQLLPAFGRPGLVFSGGAGGPLADLAESSIIDTSALAGYFRSDAASGTYNLHANVAAIATRARGLHPARSIGFTFVANPPVVAKAKVVTAIQVVMEQGETDFSYTNGRYVRMRNGQQVYDYQGKVERADNVMVMHVVDTPDGTVDTNGQPSYLTQTVGKGTLSLYRDGRVINGTWRRAKAADPFTFLDLAGHSLPMKPGQTWIMLAPQTARVTAR